MPSFAPVYSDTSAWKKKSCCGRRERHEAGSRFRLQQSYHGALTALLVPTPTPAIVAAIRTILERHNPLEENPGGVYEQCEQLAGAEADKILKRLQAAPAVKMLPHVDNAFVMEAARRALQRAGYDLTL
jgi:hypothetical protein